MIDGGDVWISDSHTGVIEERRWWPMMAVSGVGDTTRQWWWLC
ncbi:hypothetical protein HanPI659440_Chr06g0244021 [Helianthus annuus]|nr:hypothetical protein HanPI659440_Chr06g0244021 [Helianthus annuus]